MADAGKVVITPKGAYSSTATYEWLDEVSYDGKAYIALKTVTGVTPSDDGVNWRLFLAPNDIVAGNLVPTFTEASTRSNIVSGENLSTILGKVKKYFTDLKGHAFNDTVNNLTTSKTGSALDASQGKVLQGEVDEINSNLSLNLRLALEQGDLDNGGTPISSTVYKRTINYIKVKPNTEYTILRSSTSNLYVFGFQSKGIVITDGINTNKIFLVYENTQTNVSFTTTSTTQYIKVVVKNIDLSEEISIDLSNSIGETVSNNTNNIDELKNDLGGLSFSVSGTTLSITDGTNTWTLTQ